MRCLKNHLFLILFLGLCLLLLFVMFYDSMQDAEAGDSGGITVFAPSSMTETIREASEAFEAETGIDVTLNFASSSVLARQIESGAPADIYLSANQRWMDHLQDAGQIEPGTRRELLGNVLALVTWQGSEYDGAFPGAAEALEAAERIAIAEPYSVPVGIYARQALENLGLFESVTPRLVPCSNARKTLMTVQSRQVPLAIVYTTDAKAADRVEILEPFDPSLHDPIRYSGACVASSSSGAVRFLDYLTSAKAERIFTAGGFDVLRDSTSIQIGGRAAAAESKAYSIWGPLRLSLQVSLISMGLLIVPGLVLGYLLARKDFPGKALLSALIHIPLVIPPVVTGYLLLLALGPNTRLGALLKDTFGLDFAFAPAGAVAASVLLAFPLMVRSVRVSMELIDTRIEQATRTLGASALRTFLTVTLPLALPGLAAGMILSFARSMGEFGATITFAGNIENVTRTLPLAVFTHLESPQGQGAAMTLVVISVAVSAGAVLLSEAFARYTRHIHGGGYAS